ncbi:hypothetical protein CIW48_27185 [Methylobacterium sp. P1-11]|uniref:hypothetical protein n=1 Tax=Methylobacterium sp. P1-11 TaxID=2024616 RepID=UPI0011EFDCB0|nr:hypothetical protein [Methylobacterium sp. P1-11]KAA0117888.1 hypothetical protein CIW48_27185 [Methylobacterium sp. P1-11]
MRYALIAAVTACLALPSIAAAEGLPVPPHDVDRACASLRDKGLIASCVRDEQFSYDVVTSVWGRLSPARQRESYKFASEQGSTYHAFYKSLSLFVTTQAQMQQQDDDAVRPVPRFQR